MIAAYLNVGVYADFHRWLGRGAELEPMWAAWQAGDRKGALAAIPDEVVDALVVHGSFDECRDHIGRYVANGVTSRCWPSSPSGSPWRRRWPVWPHRGRPSEPIVRAAGLTGRPAAGELDPAARSELDDLSGGPEPSGLGGPV